MSETRSVVVTIPVPPKECSPNSRCHWRAKAKAVKGMRLAAWGAARVALDRCPPPSWPAAELRFTWYTRTKRRLDADNALSCLKGAIDGLRDAGVIADDNALTIHPATFAVDRENPRVVLTLEPSHPEMRSSENPVGEPSPEETGT